METIKWKGWSYAPVLLLAILLLAPVLVMPHTGVWQGMRPCIMQAAAFTLLTLLLARASWSLKGFQRLITTGPNVAVMLLVGWATLSFILMAPSGGRGRELAQAELMRLLSGAAIYFAVLYCCRSQNHLCTISYLLLDGGILAATAGILSFSPSVPATAAFGHKQLLAAFLVLLLPVAVVFAYMGQTKRQRCLAGLGWALLACGLLLTGNRTSWVSSVVGLLVLVALACSRGTHQSPQPRKSWIQKRRVVTRIMILIAIVATTFALLGGSSLVRQRLTSLTTDGSFPWRLRVWSACGKMLQDRPFMGWGIGSMPLNADRYAADVPSAGQVVQHGATLSSLAHNEYLQLATELGLVGLALYLAVLGGFFYGGVRSFKRMPAGPRKWLLLAALGAIAAQCVDALANPGWHFGDVSSLFWLLLGIGIATTRPCREFPVESDAGRQQWLGFLPARLGKAALSTIAGLTLMFASFSATLGGGVVATYYGGKPDIPRPPFFVPTPPSCNCCCCSGGPSAGEPVNLATGEEEYAPAPDLVIYNPHGPAILWQRSYHSLRGMNARPYEYDDFGSGWSHPYNVGVYDPNLPAVTAGPDNVKFVFFADGSQVSFTAPEVPSVSQPTVPCTVQTGAPLLVEWDYDADAAAGHYTITLSDQTRWITTSAHLSQATFVSNAQTGIYAYQLAQLINRTGNGLNFQYGPAASGYDNASGYPLLASITDASTGTALLTIQRTADGRGNVASISDAYGRSVYYHISYHGSSDWNPEVDAVSQVVLTDSANPPMRWSYGYQDLTFEGQAVPFLQTITVPSPTGTGTSTTTINYDPITFIVSSIVDAHGYTRQFTPVDANHTQETITDAQGNPVYSYTVGFDSNMCETTRTDGANTTSVLTRIYADPNNPYRPSSITDSTNHTTTFAWDGFGNLQSTTSPRGVQTVYTWDYSVFPLGRLTSVQEGNKTPTTFMYYEPSGLIQSIHTPYPGQTGTGATVTTAYTYDSLGNPLTVTTPGASQAPSRGSGPVRPRITGAVTNPIAHLAPRITTFDYTTDGDYTQPPAVGQPLTIRDNLGNVTHFRYDARGNRTVKIDALGNETDALYSITDETTAIISPATGQTGSGHTTTRLTYLYPNGPRMTVGTYDESNALVRQIAYAYGPEGELVSVTGSAETVGYTYDAAGRLLALSDGKNQATAYRYNTAGYLASITYPGGDSIQFLSYDAAGRLLERMDGRGLITNYVYDDPEGLLTDIQYATSPEINVHIDYDAYGRPFSTSDGTGVSTSSYDDNDTLTSVTTTYTGLPARTISYSYNPDGSRQTMNTPAGLFSYSYDAIGRMIAVIAPSGNAGRWSYLPNGWLSGQVLGLSIGTEYRYNARGLLTRLTNNVPGGTSDFTNLTYDGAGNLTSVAADISTAPAFSGQTSYTYDTKDQLRQEQSTRAGGYLHGFDYDAAGNPTTFKGVANFYNANNQNTAYTYDGNGNPILYQGTTLTFDAENRLTAIGGGWTAGYRADGLRAWKQTGSGRTYFLYDGTLPIVEMDQTGAVTAANHFGPTGLFSRQTNTGSVYYAFDPQGNVTQRVDSDRQVLSSSIFDAHGVGQSTSTAPDPFGYRGQFGYYTDTETGLQLLGHRYYDPGTGRFLTRDPVSYAGGINLYAYASNNPINAIDRLGLDWFDDLSDFFAGWADELTFGATDYVREQSGLNEGVDKSSGSYIGGTVVGGVDQAVLTCGESAEAKVVKEGVAVAEKAATAVTTRALGFTPRLTQQGLEHIVLRHWATSGAKGAGKFLSGTTAKMLKSMIQEAAASCRTLTSSRFGRLILEYDFGRQIGIDIAGNVATRLRVIVESTGEVVTAFPIK